MQTLSPRHHRTNWDTKARGYEERQSQRNSGVTWVEPGFPETALGQVRQAVGHQFQIAPEIGAATGIYVAPDQTLTAVAEPVRCGDGSAMTVR